VPKTMLEYPRCPCCGTYIVHEKDKCFYCDARFVERDCRFQTLHLFSSIRSLFQNGFRTESFEKLYEKTR
jgi:NAD-dependent DNA ligase